MGKNIGKGGKRFRSGTQKGGQSQKRELQTAEGDDEMYALVIRNVGQNMLEVQLSNGEKVQAKIPGRFVRKVWFVAGDIILVGRREFESKDQIKTVDVLHKYQPDEVKILIQENEIPRDLQQVSNNEDRSNAMLVSDMEFVKNLEKETAATAMRPDRNAVVTNDPLADFVEKLEGGDDDREDAQADDV